MAYLNDFAKNSIEKREAAKDELATSKNETTIVGTNDNSISNYTINTANKSSNDINTKEIHSTAGPKYLLQNILKTLHNVDLIATLTDDIGDDLVKYRVKVIDANGDEYSEVDPKKIPRALLVVAITEELKKFATNNGWDIVQQDGMLYLYNGTYWIKIKEDDLKNFLSDAAIKLGYYSPADAMTHNFQEISFKQFTTSSYLPAPEIDKSKVLINLKNGTYEVTESGGILREHRKEDFLTYCLPFSYDPKATAPLFKTYLNKVLPDISAQIVLQDFHGYIFTKDLKLEKALILYGGGQNGKSVQFEITSALLGEHNVSTKSLGDLVNNDSGNDNRAKLKDKLVNYGSEISSKSMDIDMFKRLVSGEPVAAREKYKTSFDLRNNCKFMFNANKLPSNIEHTEAYFRRFLIIPYNQRISDEEKDPELHLKIIANELPGILNWAIIGLNRILKAKKFSECRVAKEALDRYKKESNSVAMMIEEKGYIKKSDDKTYRIPIASLYNKYVEYCKESGLKHLNKNNFSKELKALEFKSYRTGSERGFLMAKAE